jgi:hypothetical protein
MSQEKISTPDIRISYERCIDKETNEMIVDENGRQLYYVKVYGLSKYKFSKKAFEEFEELLDYYTDLATKNKNQLTHQQLKIMKLHIELWFREKVEKDQVVVKKVVNGKRTGRKKAEERTQANEQGNESKDFGGQES